MTQKPDRAVGIGPSASVTVSFELTRQEFVRAARWQGLRSRPVKLAGQSVAVVLVVGAILLAVPSVSPVVGASVLAVGLLELLICGWIYGAAPSRQWTRPEVRERLTLEFAEGGVQIHTEHGDASNGWDRYQATIERGATYTMQMNASSTYRIVPKRAFASRDDELEFRRLAQRHTKANF